MNEISINFEYGNIHHQNPKSFKENKKQNQMFYWPVVRVQSDCVTFTATIADRDHLFRLKIEMTIIFQITAASHRVA